MVFSFGSIIKIKWSLRAVFILLIWTLCIAKVYAQPQLVSSSEQELGYGLAWTVSHPESEGESYLMGAVHLASASYYPLVSSALSAFDRSDILLIEADDSLISLEDRQSLLEQYGLYPEGETYSDHLSSSLVDQIDILFASLGVANAQERLARYKPGLLGVTLAALQAQMLGYSSELGIDHYFIEKAKGHKEIRGIETVEFQLKLLDELPLSEEVFQDALIDMADFETQWAEIEQAWRDRDAAGLYERVIGQGLKDFPRLEAYFNILFFERNIGMADAFIECAQVSTCFMVVGAGHLVGEQSVVDLLRQQGYEIRQHGVD